MTAQPAPAGDAATTPPTTANPVASAGPVAGTTRAADPPIDRRLARLHLRVGQLSLARAELEALAGSGDLDAEGLLALAEARWRTGDLAGAGEAAMAYLDGGGEGAVGFVIAAESVAAVGRPGEARRLAAKALERGELPLDRLFAGMPRASIWPADPAEAEGHVGTLFGEADHSRASRPGPTGSPAADGRAASHQRAEAPGFWDAESHAGDLPDPGVELSAGRAAVAGGALATAALHFALVIRSAPELAPAVLEATTTAEGRAAEIELVRGDAFRLVGHELDARHAYSAAAALMPAAGDRSPEDT